MMNKNNKHVCVLGLWHLGSVNAVGFAEKGFKVTGIEFDSEKKISEFMNGIPPIYEPNLEKLLKKHLKNGNLEFSSKIKKAKEADYVVIAYDSPVNEKDEVDITVVKEAAELVAPNLKEFTPVIITSQIPLGTSEKLQILIKSINNNWKSGVVYTPENLKLGTAIDRFLKPDMLVFGSNNEHASNEVLKLYEDFNTEKINMDLKSAEMVKHALNAFLATSITFINEIANLSDLLGVDSVKVGKALKLDERIGKKALLMPGLGFSGGTLARDVTQLLKFAEEYNYKAPLLESIFLINEKTFDQVIFKLKKILGQIDGKRIGILGLTYKPGTSTVRRSPAIKLIKKLKENGAICVGYDPKASEEELSYYEDLFTRAKDINSLAKGSNALVLVTEWPEFKELEYKEIFNNMKNPVIIDTKNFLDQHQIEEYGFKYTGFGRGK